jgi:outer membrane protein OmpA-like peptidoglycan-associated protein
MHLVWSLPAQFAFAFPLKEIDIMRILTGILSAGLIAGLASAAQAQTDGWYAGAEAGLAMTPSIKFKDGAKTWKENQDPGYAVLGQYGYGFGPMRLEAEVGWRSNGVDTVRQPFNNAAGKGSLDATSVMANVYYDVATGTRITPFFGAGAGAVDVNAERLRANGTTFSNDDRIVFGYQGIAGASYAVDEHLSLKAQYASHAILVGVTYKFGDAPKPAAAYVAPAVATPAPAPKAVQATPIVKNYLVFFDFDKSDITPEASKIILEAASAAKTGASTNIALTGYTDSTGSAKYNMALSLRRASAVKASLIRLGTPADQISVVGKGKGDQLVSTGDGVREPQNRRVLIVLP